MLFNLFFFVNIFQHKIKFLLRKSSLWNLPCFFFSPSLFFSSLLFSYGSHLNRKLLPDISGHLKWIQVQAVPRKGRCQPLPDSVFLPCYPGEDLCMCEIIWLGYLHLILEQHKGVQVVPDKRLLINKPLASPSITVSDELHAFCVSFFLISG